MDIARIGIVGTGTMARGIATLAASASHEVVIRSRHEASAGPVLAAVEKHLDRQVGKGTLDVDARDATVARVRCTARLADLAECDLVIESIVEDFDAKAEVLVELDQVCHPRTILATNTSTLSVTELATRTQRPAQVCGMHFFNPAPAMALVEVARTILCADDTIDAVLAMARRCGKDPIVVDDVSGFVVNQILFAYLWGALRVLGTSRSDVAEIDRAMRGGCGFPMGPFELMDLVGIDVIVAAFDALYEEYREPHFVCPPALRRMASAGLLGRKAGRGFHDYR